MVRRCPTNNIITARMSSEIPSSKLQSLVTFKDTSKAAKIGRYLENNTDCEQYLKFFINHRQENMLNATRLVYEQIRGFIQQKSTRAQLLKTLVRLHRCLRV